MSTYYEPGKRSQYVMGVSDPHMIDLINKSLSQVDKYLDKIERYGQENKEYFFKSKKDVLIKEDSKPQDIYFKDFIDNSENPFVPKITVKQCSSIPLDSNLNEAREAPEIFFKYI